MAQTDCIRLYAPKNRNLVRGLLTIFMSVVWHYADVIFNIRYFPLVLVAS